MEITNPETREHEEAWDEDEDYDEDDEDIDAEAQEIARRLGEELWADISKANAERNPASLQNPHVIAAEPAAVASSNVGVAGDVLPASSPRKEDLVIQTMWAILALVDNDPLAKSTLASTFIPNGSNVLEILKQCTTSGSITKGTAWPLSQLLVALARSDTLFGKLKHSNASAILLDKGKRKREDFDEGHHLQFHAHKRPCISNNDLQKQVIEAVQVISQALGTSPVQTLDPFLVSSIRFHLHQVFLFAVTSSAAGGPTMYALQEISGLIQVIGVLSGIQIGQPPEPTVHSPRPIFNPAFPCHNAQPASLATDIGTAVYPCLVAGCHKTFSRLYSLRAHQRSHPSHRPFRCSVCPASFARNHDLKRHLRLHDKKAWRCNGCNKVFSRRDAIKRHKTGIKNKGPKSGMCLVAEVTEVQLDGEDGEDSLRDERRAKLWNGIAMSEAHDVSASNSQVIHTDVHALEEGEINPAVIAGIQATIMSLHGRLQALVGGVLGVPLSHPVSTPTDPTTGQATLAGVIARAQSSKFPSSHSVVGARMPVGTTTMNASTVELPATGENSSRAQTLGENPENHIPLPSLSMYGLSDEQTHLLEIAIANAASAAQAQAEAEAALEEEEEEDNDQDEYESEMEQDQEQVAT